MMLDSQVPASPPEMVVTDEPALAIACAYAPDGEPERTNEELIRHLANSLVSYLSAMVDLCGVGKCVLYNKTFTLKLELSPSAVAIEDFLKEQPHDKD